MHTPKILVADDEPAILDLVTLCLHRAGFGVVPCRSGIEAVAAYRKRHRTIAAALLDVQMPAPDGPHTLALLHGVNPSLPCVFMSGSTGRYDVQDLFDLGASCVLQKPFALTDLVDAVWQASGVAITDSARWRP
jgi:CheY-like chemotaxis protein